MVKIFCSATDLSAKQIITLQENEAELQQRRFNSGNENANENGDPALAR